MLTTLATSVIALLTEILPTVGVGTSVGTVITTLTQLIPVAVSEGQALLTPIKNIIAALSGNDAVTPAELTQLQALDAQTDAAFEAAAKAAGAP
jgi:predicted histidine transporter YuiF (NhaC family)